MAVADKLAWDVAKELWRKGITTLQIERETGIKAVTVRKRASREHWDAALAHDAVTADNAKIASVQEIADRISSRVVHLSEFLLQRLRDLGDPGSFRDCKDYAQALSTSYMAARKALGLDNESGSRVLTVNILNPQRAIPGIDCPVIDAQIVQDEPKAIGVPMPADAVPEAKQAS